MERSTGQTGGAGAGSAEPGPGRADGAAGGGRGEGASGALPGRRSLPRQMLPGGPGGCPGLPRRPRGLSAPSPAGGVPGSSGVSAAAGPSRQWHLLCLFPADSAAPLPALQSERCPGPGRPGRGAKTGPTQNTRPAEPPAPTPHCRPVRAGSEAAEAGGRERPGIEKDIARDSSSGPARVGSLPAGRPVSGKFPRSDLS